MFFSEDIISRGELIGAGASAAVYAVSDTCCVKVMDTEDMLTARQRSLLSMMSDAFAGKLHSSLASRCLQEASVMRELADEENIVRMTGVSQEPSAGSGYRTYLYMERLTPLTEYLKSHALTGEEAIRLCRTLCRDLCRALCSCQKKNIIHQDIKEANIFVTSNGRFKLGDFGIARKASKKNLLASSGCTVNSAAPEVLAGEDTSFQSDLYSLGLVMYRILNHGRNPFSSDPVEDTEKRMQGQLFPVPANTDPAVFAVISKACSFHPSDRYASAQEMLEALEKSDAEAGAAA